MFFLLFLQDLDLLLEVVNSFPDFLVEAISETRYQCKPEVLFHSPDRLIDQGVAGKRFRDQAVQGKLAHALMIRQYLHSTR